MACFFLLDKKIVYIFASVKTNKNIHDETTNDHSHVATGHHGPCTGRLPRADQS